MAFVDSDQHQQLLDLRAENTALREQLTRCEGSRRVHELDNHHNALACGYCAGPIKDEVTRLQAELAQVTQERDRLLRGEFTSEEFQNLCHNMDIQKGFDAFADGCEAYQEKLFGRCRTKGKVL